MQSLYYIVCALLLMGSILAVVPMRSAGGVPISSSPSRARAYLRQLTSCCCTTNPRFILRSSDRHHGDLLIMATYPVARSKA